MEKVLFSTDFSKNAEKALVYAIDIAKKSKKKLSLLNVCDPSFMGVTYDHRTDKKIESSSEGGYNSIAKKKLRQIVDDNNLNDIQHEYIVKEGDVQNEILKEIDKASTYMTVMGIKGESAAKELFIGSVTNGIMQHASCPVLAIPETANFEGISKIVCAVELQYNEASTINYVVELAKLYEASVTILHIDYDDTTKAKSLAELKSMVDKIAYPKVAYKEIISRDVAEGIHEYVKTQEKGTMLAMTTHTISLLDKLFHKSLTKQILFHTDIPFLIFSRKKYDTIFLG